MTPKQKQWVDNSPFSELMEKWRSEWDKDDPLLLDDEFLRYYSRVYIHRLQELSQIEYDKVSNGKENATKRSSEYNSLQRFYE